MTVNYLLNNDTNDGCIKITEGKGDFPFILIDNKFASASISLYGAQVLSYQLKNDQQSGERDNESAKENELLFVSESAYFEKGKAIKGGIPICWPWFGRDPENLDRKMHGFARNMLWQLEETKSSDTGSTVIVLSLTHTKGTLALWPHEFKVTLSITIGNALKLSLLTENIGESSFRITQAFHSYFLIDDIKRIKIEGLDNLTYIDTVNGLNETKLQEGIVIVDQEVDRIYTDAPTSTILIDEKQQRKVSIESYGSKTTVVWNPWIEISKNSRDITDHAYRRFICIETANAAKDMIVIEPSKSYAIEAEYTVASI